MLLHDFLINSSKKYPLKHALVFESKRYTYQEIRKKASNTASFLIRHGLLKGERVGIYLENCPESVFSIFGVLEAGGCFVIINPGIKSSKLKHILIDSGLRFVITSITGNAELEKICGEIDNPPLVVFADSLHKKNEHPLETAKTNSPLLRSPIIDADLAAIIYTSGSTGKPKGVTMTHRNMVSAATSITTYLENIESDIILNMLPFSFDYGLYQLLMTFKFGGTLVLEKRFGFPYQVIEIIKREKITGLPFVPTMFAIILQLENLQKENMESVRYITNTAAALPPAFIPRLRAAFPNARIFSMYGLTECKRVSYLPPDMIEKKPNSVGIPMPNLEVWIEDNNGNRMEPGQIGELVVRGASVMQGYWNDLETTAKVLKKGIYPWENVLLTGDLFKMDDDGYLYFMGRKDDIIKSRGERVSPREIEDVLYGMDEILNARVTGEPHDIFGQIIKSEIIIKDGFALDEKQVKAHCKRHLEDLMIPQIIKFVKTLPMSTSGKIKRKD